MVSFHTPDMALAQVQDGIITGGSQKPPTLYPSNDSQGTPEANIECATSEYVNLSAFYEYNPADSRNIPNDTYHEASECETSNSPCIETLSCNLDIVHGASYNNGDQTEVPPNGRGRRDNSYINKQ